MPDPQDRDQADSPLEQVTGERDVHPEEERARQDDEQPSTTDEDGGDRPARPSGDARGPRPVR
ncbi:hypothetical protein [Streptomyces sp. NPDC002640]